MKHTCELRTDAERIWTAALRAVDPEAAVHRAVKRRGSILRLGKQRYDLDRVENVWALGAGKAAAPMGRALESILGRRLAGGLLVTKYGHGLDLQRLELLEAGHPLPDANGVAAGKRVIRFAEERVGRHDLVFCLLSGGGSALLVSPAPGVDWEDKQRCTQLLLKSAASIHEVNAVRKHLSALKGGGLARLLARVPVVSLILSDVVGDSLDTIASGPLAPDPTTFSDCQRILDRLGIADRMPSSIVQRIRRGAAGKIPETPKPGDPVFLDKRHAIVASNTQACTAALREARALGYRAMVLTSRNEGDTAESARFHMNILHEVVLQRRPLRAPACIISGGETTVKVTGKGKGGRNQEFALQCAPFLPDLPAPCLVASLGTDGTDGPTDAAGALADNTTLGRAEACAPGFFEQCREDNNSYELFSRLDDLILTGPTRTNVMDLRIILVGLQNPSESITR